MLTEEMNMRGPGTIEDIEELEEQVTLNMLSIDQNGDGRLCVDEMMDHLYEELWKKEAWVS